MIFNVSPGKIFGSWLRCHEFLRANAALINLIAYGCVLEVQQRSSTLSSFDMKIALVSCFLRFTPARRIALRQLAQSCIKDTIPQCVVRGASPIGSQTVDSLG